MLSLNQYILTCILSLIVSIVAAPTMGLHSRDGSSTSTSSSIINANVTISSTYIVQSGDSVASLVAKFNLGICDLARFNGLANPDFIYPGEAFIIPAASSNPDDYSCLNVNNTQATSTCIYGGPHVYTTMPGDTIEKIAYERYNITINSILSYSPQTAYISTTAPGPHTPLEAGQTVKIPLCDNSQCVIETFPFYYGTFVDLARVHGSTVGQIMSLNPGFNHSDGGCCVGAELTLPVNCTLQS